MSIYGNDPVPESCGISCTTSVVAEKCRGYDTWRGGRVAKVDGLLTRYMRNHVPGSNPGLSVLREYVLRDNPEEVASPVVSPCVQDSIKVF